MLFKPGVEQGTFAAQGQHYALALKPGAAELELRKQKHAAKVAISFPGSKPSALVAQQPQKTVVSEFLGNDRSHWRTGLPTFARVTANGVYPGIDLTYYGNQERLEYDFVVAPNAQPGRIRMRFDSDVRLSLNSAGDLLIHTSAGDITEQRPLVYQTISGARREVRASFALLAGNTVGFNVGNYDHSQPLVIDPQISYSSFVGGSGEEQALAVAVDNSGNAYVAGYTTTNNNGDLDVLLASFNPAGNTFNYIVQAGGYTYGLGGSSDDVGNAIAVDGAGNAYVAGRTRSNDFPVTTGAYQSARAGNDDAFLLKVDPSGKTLLYSTYLGGGSTDEAWGVAVDPAGGVYVAGDTNSDSFPVTNGVFQKTRSGGYDAFLTKFAADGTLVFSTFLGGKGDDRAFAIAVDAAGNSYLTGNTHSDEFPVSATVLQTARSGGDDGFVVKMNANGSNAIFSTYLGGSSDENAIAIALDSANNVFVAGTTASSNFPTTPGAYKTSYFGGTSDMFVSRIAADGRSLLYSTFVGSHGTDRANGIAVDSAGNAVVVGDTDSDEYMVTSDAAQNRRSGGLDGVITRLNPAGNAVLYSSFIGGKGDDSAQAIAMDVAGNAYVAGYTASSNFPVASGAAQSYPGGGPSDAFTLKYVFGPILPAVSTNGVVNAASFAGGAAVAPGSIISIFGSSFTKIPVAASSTPLPVNLAGVGVTINGIAAPLFYVGPNQINAQVPYEVQPGTASVVVTGIAGASMSTTITVAKASPGIFLNGAHAVVINQDGTLNTTANPAHTGSIVTVYLNGLGALDHPVQTGDVASSVVLSRASQSYFATINGQTAMVMYLGLTPGFVGLAQANIVVPPGVTGDVPLFINVGGAPSNTAVISVAP